MKCERVVGEALFNLPAKKTVDDSTRRAGKQSSIFNTYFNGGGIGMFTRHLSSMRFWLSAVSMSLLSVAFAQLPTVITTIPSFNQIALSGQPQISVTFNVPIEELPAFIENNRWFYRNN